MENFCCNLCKTCVTVKEREFFHCILYCSAVEHQRGTFFPKCILSLLILVMVVLQEWCLFQMAFRRLLVSWLSHQRSLRRQELSQPTGGSILLTQISISGSRLHRLLRRDRALICICQLSCFSFSLKFSLKIVIEGGFLSSSDLSVSL